MSNKMYGHSDTVNGTACEKKTNSSQSNMSDLWPCPFCGGKEIGYSDNEDWGFICCKGCTASVGMDFEDLPGYFEENAPMEDCSDETKQPLKELWNKRTREQT